MSTLEESSKNKPERKTGNLRKGRLSIPHARYFVTMTSHQRKRDLATPTITESIRSVLRQIHLNQDFELHCATVMPDHLHLLFTLGDKLSLTQCVRKFKAQTKHALESHQLKWQANYFDHRLRSDVPLETFARYIFLNPYKKALLPPHQEWAGWILNQNFQPEFTEALIDGRYPQSEWLEHDSNIQELLKRYLEYKEPQT